MEFCPQLTAFQGVIISADNVHPFSRLSSKSGNEDQINYIVEKISNFLKEARLIDENGPVKESIEKLRKLAYYMILNADLTVLLGMTDLEEIESVVWTIPTIPKCLLCEIFWSLHFEQFISESIAYSYPELGIELSGAFNSSIKYFKPGECLNKLSIISSALYRLLRRSIYFNSNNILREKLAMIYHNLKTTLNFFSDPPYAETLRDLSEDDMYRYKGKCLYTVITLVYDCLEQFTAMQELNSFDAQIYKLTYLDGTVNQQLRFKTCNTPNEEILACLNKCNEALLDKCQVIVMGISVDIFCAWSEFEQNGRTVQKLIGEFCYKLRLKLKSVPSVADHPLTNMLKQVLCKPADVNDIIRTAEPEFIIKTIAENNEDKVVWIKALLERAQFLQTEALVSCVATNSKLLSEEESFEAYRKVKNHMLNQPGSEDYLEPFLVKLFQQCNVKVKHDILEEYFSSNCFTDMLETEDFSNMMTEVFNKLIVSPDADLTHILSLFLQNPHKVYSKIFSLAIENAQQTDIMLKAMKLLVKFCNHYYICDTEPCIIKITQDTLGQLDTDSKKQNFINFLCALKNINYITGTKLLLLIITPNIHKSLLSKDLVCLSIQCRLIKDAYSIEELVEFRAPMLAMIAQVLETLRWKFNTFSNIAPPNLQMTLDLQTSLFSTYDTGIPDREANWLKVKIRNIQPLNMYYYRKLWNPPGGNYVEVLSGMNINVAMDTQPLIIWLSQVLCSTTQQEWCNVWDSLVAFGDVRILEMFHNSMTLMSWAKNKKANRTEATWACLIYCLTNFMFITRYKYFKEPLTDSQVSNVVEKIVFICNLIEDGSDDLSTLFMPLLAYLAERKEDYDFDVSHHLSQKLKHTKYIDTLSKVFLNRS